ncbi:uncharacterized protein LOC144283713 isoform X1 [Canis aureus]
MRTVGVTEDEGIVLWMVGLHGVLFCLRERETVQRRYPCCLKMLARRYISRLPTTSGDHTYLQGSLHSVLQNVWLALIPGTKERPFTFHISQMRPRRHSHICAQVCMCVYVFVTDKVRKLRHSELKQLVRSHNLVSGCAGFEQRHSGKARAGYNILRRRPNIPSRLLVCCLLLSC